MTKAMNLVIKLKPNVERTPVEGVQRLDVRCNQDGMLTVTADPETLARIGGRRVFGAAGPVRKLLLDRIADAWYAAGCRNVALSNFRPALLPTTGEEHFSVLMPPTVRGKCPSCGLEHLFLDSQGNVTCSVAECKDPTAADRLLHG